MSDRAFHLLLLAVLAAGLCIYFFIFIRENATPEVQYACSNMNFWCTSIETAKACGVLELCMMQWKAKELGNKTKAKEVVAKPVAVVVYFESLCPDSERFITVRLYPAYRALLGKNIFKLTLIPYGNAKESREVDQWLFSCQHGEAECLGNILETCAIYELKNITVWMPFVFCMEKNKATIKAAKQCCKDLGIDFDPIDKCRKGKIGNELQHQMALKTQALKPKHTFIPWITINGKSEGLQIKALRNLLGLICSTYQGVKPDACKKQQVYPS